MNKIKEFFKTKKGKIITSVTLVILVLLFCAIFFKKEPLRFEDYIFATDVSFSEINKDALQGRLADTLASQVMKEKMNLVTILMLVPTSILMKVEAIKTFCYLN